MARAFAGDLEPGDLITALPTGLRLVSTGTGFTEPATVIPGKGLMVATVREEHPTDPHRVLFRASNGVFYDLHRATVVRVAGGRAAAAPGYTPSGFARHAATRYGVRP